MEGATNIQRIHRHRDIDPYTYLRAIFTCLPHLIDLPRAAGAPLDSLNCLCGTPDEFSCRVVDYRKKPIRLLE